MDVPRKASQRRKPLRAISPRATEEGSESRTQARWRCPLLPTATPRLDGSQGGAGLAGRGLDEPSGWYSQWPACSGVIPTPAEPATHLLCWALLGPRLPGPGRGDAGQTGHRVIGVMEGVALRCRSPDTHRVEGSECVLLVQEGGKGVPGRGNSKHRGLECG